MVTAYIYLFYEGINAGNLGNCTYTLFHAHNSIHTRGAYIFTPFHVYNNAGNHENHLFTLSYA